MKALGSLRLISFVVKPQRPVSFFCRAPYSAMASPQAASTPLAQDAQPQQQARVAKRTNGGTPGPNKKKFKPKKTKREKNIKEGSSEEILRLDILSLIESQRAKNGVASDEEAKKEPVLPEEGSFIDVEILELSSTGDGLGMVEGSEQVYVVPFTVPGDVAHVKVFRHITQLNQTIADFKSITKPSPMRDDSRIQCKYFNSCGGCQFQMLSYDDQLVLKRRVLEKAFKNFSNLNPELVPEIQPTFGSPLQYGYRTKLTPHFDGPPGPRRGKNQRLPFPSCPDVGFMLKGQRKVIDIEDCPIGTEAVRSGMQRERKRMQEEYLKYQRGATILLRENTERFPKDGEKQPPAETPPYAVRAETDSYVEIKSCETDQRATITEHIGPYTFTNPAGTFFQNNNSILGPFTDFIRSHILPPPASTTSTSSPIKYLIDAYSGSGLFTITLSSVFTHSIGIDIAPDSITSARHNASLNNLTPERCTFIAADAGELFKSVEYPADETVVVLDPPRKGCDADFLDQLRRFGPRRVVYVSCNVHTQARDVGVLVRGEGEGRRYEIESLRGFDFFPQTGHVEGVAILNRVEEDVNGSAQASAEGTSKDASS
jgi:tRNA (uracil-5-)-methyltransferase